MPADVSVDCDIAYEYIKVVASGSKVITATNPFTTYKYRLFFCFCSCFVNGEKAELSWCFTEIIDAM